MAVGTLIVDIRIATSASLKDKRMVIRHLLDTARRRFSVAASEIGHHDLRQRSLLGFAAIASDAGHVEEVLDHLDRFIWSHPEVEVLSSTRRWMDLEH